jgi:diguanylate cyclase
VNISDLWQLTQLNLGAGKEDPKQAPDVWHPQFVELTRALLTLVQQYRWEIEEINSKSYLSDIDSWKQTLPMVASPESISDFRKKVYERSNDYLKAEKNYLVEREAELQTLVSLLSEAVSAVATENGAYHQEVMQRAQGLSQISQLEDIRKIRTLLAKEVEQLKEVVKKKQTEDREQQEQLSRYVEGLKTKLQTAVNRSLKDPLTGLFNRQGWDQEIINACHSAAVMNVSFALALVDIDNFKQINDKHGHQVGDLILSKVGKDFRESFRSEDYLARYGGDEFAFLLQTPSLDKAHKRLERMCKEISSPTYQCTVEKTEYYLRISLSCGVSFYRSGDTPESLFRRADQSLYLAKQAGKNRVVAETAIVKQSA